MFITVFHLNEGSKNYVGPFVDYKAAEYFRSQWAKRENVKEIEIIRLEKPLTPDQCRLPEWTTQVGAFKAK